MMWSSKKVLTWDPLSHSVQCCTWVACIVIGSTMSSPVGNVSECKSYWASDFPIIALMALPIFPALTAFSLSAEAFNICCLSRLLCRPCIFFLILSSSIRNQLASSGYCLCSTSLQKVGPRPINCASSCSSLVSN